jgi:hypothetical protein
MSNPVTKYIAINKIVVIVGTYFIFSTILKATSGTDVCIPCLWKTIFGFHCPGCGLTTALISLMKLDFRGAFESNWIIFIVMPLGVYYFTNDFIRFKRKYNA